MKKPILFVLALGVVFLAGWFWWSTKPEAQKDNYDFVAEASYNCAAGKNIKASYYKGPAAPASPGEPPTPSGKVVLVLSDGREMTLPQTISGSGIRYATSDESIVFWSKGEGAFVTENNVETYSGCIQIKN